MAFFLGVGFPKTNWLPLQMDGWNTTLSTFLLGFGLFSGALAVSFRKGRFSFEI